MRAPHRLAVDGHHLALGDLRHGLDPRHKTMLKLLRVQAGEDVSNSSLLCIAKADPDHQGYEDRQEEKLYQDDCCPEGIPCYSYTF